MYFEFRRQRVGDQLCLSDYILPAQNGKRDHLAMFVVTAGEGVRERSEKAKNDGYYFKSHGLQALAIETAEACAEWLHRRIREDWGFPDPPELTMRNDSRRDIAESVTALAIRLARIWKIRRECGNCCGRKKSACNSPKAS